MKSKNLFSERGQALVVIALAAIVLFGFTALAIDGSAKLSDRRHAQNAADTAAVAAALAKVNGLLVPTNTTTPAVCPASTTPYSDVCNLLLNAGKDRAASNGYGNDLVTNTVEVYSPPISGYYSTVANKNNYVQVIITSHVKTYFMRVLGIQQSDNIVQAVAFAEPGGKIASGSAIVSFDPNPSCSGGNGIGGGSVDVTGSGNINLTGGGIFVNSNASCGYTQTSCNVTLSIASPAGINSAGSPIVIKDALTNANCNTAGVSTNTSQIQKLVSDEIYMPARPASCSSHTPAGTWSRNGRNYTLQPGYYSGNFPPNAVTNSNNNITLASGVYCIDGTASQGISWNNGTYNTLTGSGVTLYIITGGGFSMSGGTLNLTAPTSATDPYRGYLIILDGNQNTHPNCTINGNGASTIEGTIFAPYCNVRVNGSSGTDAFGAQIAGWDITLNGGTTINFTYDPAKNAQINRKVGLMK